MDFGQHINSFYYLKLMLVSGTAVSNSSVGSGRPVKHLYTYDEHEYGMLQLHVRCISHTPYAVVEKVQLVQYPV